MFEIMYFLQKNNQKPKAASVQQGAGIAHLKSLAKKFGIYIS